MLRVSVQAGNSISRLAQLGRSLVLRHPKANAFELSRPGLLSKRYVRPVGGQQAIGRIAVTGNESAKPDDPDYDEAVAADKRGHDSRFVTGEGCNKAHRNSSKDQREDFLSAWRTPVVAALHLLLRQRGGKTGKARI
jgi:hypothetical protein